MWHAGTDQIGFTTAGVNRLTIATDAITSTLPITAKSLTSADGDIYLATWSIDASAHNVSSNNVYYSNATHNFTGTIVGSLTGNVTGNVTGSSGSTTGNAATASVATTIALVATNTTAATHYPVFVDTATGNENPRTDTGFTYNPSTGVLTSTTFSGNLSGNATTATAATVTTSATASNFVIPFVNSIAATTGNYGLLQDSVASFTYNPSTNVVTAGTFSGALSGNATTSSSTTGNAATATKLATARAIAVSGAVTGTANFDGSGNISIATTATADPTLTLSGDASGSATFTNLGNATLAVVVADDSHNHIISNVDGLQTELNAKLPLAGGSMSGALSCSQPIVATTIDATGRGVGIIAGASGNAILQFLNSAANAQWTSLVGTNALLTCTTNFTSSGNITSASDARLKENVVTIDSALNKVEQMRGVYFNKIDDETKTRNVGVIAQEMEEVLPEVVHTREDGMKSVAYANIVGVLIEAIKELKAEIDILKANK
jgi:hypothetical protein